MVKRRIKSWLKVCKEIWDAIKKSRGVRRVSALYALTLGLYTVAGYIEPRIPEAINRTPRLNALLSWRSWIILALVIVIVFIVEGASRVKRRKLRQQANAHRAEVERWKAKLQEIEGKLETERENRNPDLSKSRLEEILIAQSPRVDGGTDTAIVIRLVIGNSGADSIAKAWRLTLEVPTANSIELFPLHMDGPMRFFRQGGLPTVVLQEQDFIYNKVASTPIPRGGEVPGHLFFAVRGDPNAAPIGTELTLYFKDILGREYSLSEKLSVLSRGNEPRYVPGTSMTLIPYKSSAKKRKKKH